MIENVGWQLRVTENQHVQVSFSVIIFGVAQLIQRILFWRIHYFSIYLTQINFIFQGNSKTEDGALLPFTFKRDLTIETFNNLFGNDKAETDTSSIHGVGGLNKAKQLKQFTLIFPLNTHSIVFYLYFTV